MMEGADFTQKNMLKLLKNNKVQRNTQPSPPAFLPSLLRSQADTM